MLISKIVSEIDAQLEKLMAAREEIATLYAVESAVPRRGRKPKVSAEAADAGGAELEPDAQAPMTGRVAAKEPRERRTAKRSKVAEPGALASKVPAGAVFVSPSEVARRAEAKAAAVIVKPASTEVHPVESGFDALVREAAARSRAVVQ